MNATSPEVVLQQVEALLQRRRYPQALALLKPALVNYPDHVELLLQAAWIDYLEDRPDQAMHTIRQVLTSAPLNESARLLYFHLLVEKAQSVDAERVVIDLLREYPEHASYYGRYADLMLRTLNVGKARQLAMEGLKYESEDLDCLSALTVCDFIESRSGEVSHSLQQMLVRHPQSVRTLVLIVIALQERGDHRGAKRVSQELVQANPDNESLVSIARELKTTTHWSMLPLWPMQRWGWAASFGIWILIIVGSRAIQKINPAWSGTFLGIVLIYVAYSWIWPPILRRLMK
jgi:tetratricopeptide (TPR) repeat protein